VEPLVEPWGYLGTIQPIFRKSFPTIPACAYHIGMIARKPPLSKFYPVAQHKTSAAIDKHLLDPVADLFY